MEQESKEPEYTNPDHIYNGDPMIPLSEAFEFAEWCSNNKWHFDSDLGFWWKHNPSGIYRKERKTFELWKIFKEEKNK